jgi:hypothetical protein
MINVVNALFLRTNVLIIRYFHLQFYFSLLHIRLLSFFLRKIISSLRNEHIMEASTNVDEGYVDNIRALIKSGFLVQLLDSQEGIPLCDNFRVGGCGRGS